jgi:chromosome segregation ATPase
MKSRFLLRYFAMGLLFGALLIPPLPAQAQWAVFDGSQYALQIKKRIDELNRWLETVRQYQEMYTKAVEQVTTLRGVLQTVDKTLFKNQQAALLANDIGKIISDSQKLKQRLESSVRYQIQWLKAIDDRLSRGIFDPDADLRDFQNYLLYTMGRDARQTVDQMLRTAKADAELAAWMDERKNAGVSILTLTKKLKDYSARLNLERALPDNQYNIQHLNDAITQTQKEIDDLKKRIKELDEKIAQRVKQHNLRLQDMENFGYEVQASNEMWKELQKTKDDLQKTMDSLILGTTPPAPAE